jgi:hypothetical protein
MRHCALLLLVGLLLALALASVHQEHEHGIPSMDASTAVPVTAQASARRLAITVHRHKSVQLLSEDFSEERLDDPAALAGFRDAAVCDLSVSACLTVPASRKRTLMNDTEIEYFVTMTGARLESVRFATRGYFLG